MASDDEPQISILDARLAEIDRRLSRIQTGLAEDVSASASPRTPAPAPAPAGELPPRIAVPEPGGRPRPAARPGSDDAPDDAQLVVAELRGLISDHARLLDRLGEILASGERVLTAASRAATPDPAAGPAGDDAQSGAVTVTAGPFGSIEAVRGFERSLQRLPGVTGVEVRGYESGDRAVVDVHLAAETA